MFKLVVLSALIAVAVARPGNLHSIPTVYSAPLIQEHSFEKVGEVVKSVPTGVTHQSSTVVHNTAHHVEPIVAPVVKTYSAAPVIKTIQTPLIQTYAAAPVLKTYAPAPVAKTVHTPVVHTYAAVHPLTHVARYGYEVATPIGIHSAPLTYAAGW